MSKNRGNAASMKAFRPDFRFSNSPKLAALKDQLQFNATLLEDKTLHICFTNDASGKTAADAFKQAQGN